jgi:reactive intermediate/imine deaminase
MEPPFVKKPFGPPGPYPYTAAMRAGDFVFVSGQVPAGPDGELVSGGIEAQTRACLDNVKATLALAGCGLDDVVKCTVFLADARDFARFNAVYATYFTGAPPARSTVNAPLVVDARIEIEAIAYRPLEGASA